LAVVALNHLLTASLFELIQVALPEPFAPWAMLAAAAAGFVLVAFWLHSRRFEHQSPIWGYLVAIGCADTVGLAVHDLLLPVPTPAHRIAPELILVALSIPLLIWTATRLQHLRHRWRTVITLSRQASKDRAKSAPLRQLVLFVSPPTVIPETAPGSPACFQLEGKNKVCLSGNLQEDIRKLDELGMHNWQQLLRGIEAHAASLKEVFLVGSKDTSGARHSARPAGQRAPYTEGSHLYLPHCEQFLRPYLPRVQFYPSREVDFEDSEELAPLLRGIQEEAGERAGAADFAVDVTGGQKTNSIVAAALTLLSKSVVQYVQTAPRTPATTGAKAPPTIEAYIYDLRLDQLSD